MFYHRDTVAGDIVPDEIIDGFDTHQHIVGTIHHVEFIDDRWRDGVPHRVVTLLQPPNPPEEPEPGQIRTDMVAVLDGPSTFQAGAVAILVLLRRYLEGIEAMDLESGMEQPRVRLLTRHRVVPGKDDGFIRHEDGRVQIRVEHLQELDFRGKLLRVRMPGTCRSISAFRNSSWSPRGSTVTMRAGLVSANRTSPSITATAAAPWLHKPTSWRD